MVNFPLIESLSVEGYELYPGTSEKPGLQAAFLPGVTLILGANGLGKSTLVHLLFRMLGGNAELKGSGFDGLGSGQLEVRSLYPHELRVFAARVGDAAAHGRATVRLTAGTTRLELTRELSSLTLTALAVDEEVLEPDEENFRQSIVAASALDHFLDWILVLRYLVFYFDDRRSLVWDPTAQRRLLPLLFIPTTRTDPIRELTNRILVQDSAVRNLNATLVKQEREMRAQERAQNLQPTVKAELDVLTARRASETDRLEELQSKVVPLEAARSEARLSYLQAVERRESLAVELDRIRIDHVRAAFPSSGESAAYILTHLMADADCLVCGNTAPDAAAALRARIETDHCAICGSELAKSHQIRPDGAEVQILRSKLADARLAEDSAFDDRQRADRLFAETLADIAQLENSVNSTSRQIDLLESRLPESARTTNKRREALAALRAGNEIARENVFSLKAELTTLVDKQNLELSAYKDSIKAQFEHHAQDFLVEDCALVWTSHPEQIGQLGHGIQFSVFQIDMGGGSISGLTRRAGAQQVSESQREFIDIAFRMALIGVAGANTAGSIVIDAPESSLDAVFAPRAANVLTSFAPSDGNSRMIITSNLVDGQLIPQIAARAGIEDANSERVVNLFETAAKTAALRKYDAEYSAALRRAFKAPDNE